MLNRKWLISAAVAATFTVVAPIAQAGVDFSISVAPPALRYEPVPAPRYGHVWIPGYWDWRHHRYQWVGGRWERDRVGHYYHPHRWVQRDNHWHAERGYWNRSRYSGDRDRDGIPNYRDRDRDNDGVANRYDRAPDNPRRR